MVWVESIGFRLVWSVACNWPSPLLDNSTDIEMGLKPRYG